MSEPVIRESSARSGPAAKRADRRALVLRFDSVRAFTEDLCAPLDPEDALLQAMPDVSPTKWHLAHTTWFFERFVLHEHVGGYEPFDASYYYLFNSYYHSVGPMHARPKRGLLSRPSLETVRSYRAEVDARIRKLASGCDEATLDRIAPLLTLGCHHEQQHQELIVTDIKYNLSCSPLLPPVYAASPQIAVRAPEQEWVDFDGGAFAIGWDGVGFGFDNEAPRHEVLLRPYRLASRLVTNAEYRAFVEAGGYEKPELWLDAGFATVTERGWRHPLYWLRDGDGWRQYTVTGALPLADAEPVCHLSYFEADAFARWAGARLPTEAEWEVAAAGAPIAGNLAESGRFHVAPAANPSRGALQQLYGDVWEWTASPYVGYPGYRPPAGAIGEYNGKFMCNQYVLRGGSCATPRTHLRPSYRNFFPADARWQFAGLRLAADA